MMAIRIGLALVAALLAAQPADAQARYPDKPVRFIVGFTAGSATDTTARMFAQKFQDAWNVPVTVENVPGAGGSVGGDRVAKSAPDGSTFYWGANGALTINPTLQANPTYEVQRDLAPVARLLVMASIVAVGNDVPAKSVAELFTLAKAQPGKLSYSTSGAGSGPHLAAEMFKEATGTFIVHVPYRGGGPAIGDLIAGHVQLSFMTVLEASGHIKAGKLRALAVTGSQRVPALPEVPTLAEAALPGFNSISWIGVLAPAGTPKEIVDKVSSDVREVLASDDVKLKLIELGAVPAGTTPAQFQALIASDRKRYEQVIKDKKITVD